MPNFECESHEASHLALVGASGVVMLVILLRGFNEKMKRPAAQFLSG